jgi:23S rRNA pseudouridine1911/1915/1917 synthase
MDGQEVVFVVKDEEGGAGGEERLDRVLAARLPDLSRAQAQRLIKGADVTVNGRPSKPSYRVQVGDEIAVRVPVEALEVVLPG